MPLAPNLLWQFPKHSSLIRTAPEVDDSQSGWVIDRVIKCADKFKSSVIAYLGFAFTADVYDLRESTAFDIVKKLKYETSENC